MLVSFRWESKIRGKSASLQASALPASARKRASSAAARVSSTEVPRALLPRRTPLRDNQSQPGTLQGAKKNSSRKASTFRQVTTKRTCEHGWCRRTRRRSTSRLLARAWSLRVHLPLLLLAGKGNPHSRAYLGVAGCTASSTTCCPLQRLANVDDFTSFDGQVRSLGEC